MAWPPSSTAYEGMRGDDYAIPRRPVPRSAWSGTDTKIANHQYTSLASPYEHQGQQQNNSPPHSVVSNLQYFEQDAPYSSTTGFLENGAQRGPRHSPASNGLIGNAWRPGFWTQFPWLGILALFLTILATLACIVVLLKSQGVPIESWGGLFQPTVYISIFTALANVSLTYALYQGVVISFWRKAGQGATLSELHHYWQSGSSLWGAFLAIFGSRGKVTGIACIMTVLSIGRGPVMQRASLVKNIVVSQNGTLSIFSAIRLPEGYAGRDTGRTSSPSFMNPNFTNIVQAYSNKDEIVGIWSGCDSTCYADVKGFGFGVSCNVSQTQIDVGPIMFPNGTYDRIRDPTEVFSADAWETQIHNSNLSAPYNYALLLNTTFMGVLNKGENVSFISDLCALRAGIVSYPIMISNNTITLQSSSWRNDTFLEDVGMLYLPYNSVSNMAGFILAAKGLYAGTADIQFGGGAGWILNLNGASANRYLERTDPSSNFYEVSSNVSWRDPMEDMINSMREIAFRTSLQIAADNTSYPNASQNIQFFGERPETVYTANYSYMIGAAVLSLVGALAVLPTYRGFWELGRPVTLSPLEIAKAFNAPLLRDVEGNKPADSMLPELGGTKVRYGDTGMVVEGPFTSSFGTEEAVRRIAMGPAADVRPPVDGARYV